METLVFLFYRQLLRKVQLYYSYSYLIDQSQILTQPENELSGILLNEVRWVYQLSLQLAQHSYFVHLYQVTYKRFDPVLYAHLWFEVAGERRYQI